jgi:phospholipid/cholesterol/gamma-HCH transport system substrate-binding protein
MSSTAKYELQAGVFLLIALAMFCVSIFILGKDRQVFSEQVPYQTTFRDIKGLNPGAPVRLGGITIGRVASIKFASDIKDPNVYVELLVNEEFAPRLRTDATATIDTQGLLGDRFVTVVGGTSPTQLDPKIKIAPIEASDIGQAMGQIGTVMDNTAQITTKINSILSEIEGAPLDDLTRTINSVSAIADEIKNGKGLLSGLIYNPQGKETVGSISETAKALAEASSGIADIATQVKSGKGLLNNLIYGESPQGMSDLIASLNRTASHLETASQALAQGSGTLGALLIDSKLYDNIVEVTDDAKRSFILRRAIKKSLEDKKGTETAEEIK